MTNSNEKPPRVIDLADARKRQKTTHKSERSGASARAGLNGAAKVSKGGNKLGFWAYVQFFFFLGLLGYFMQLCSVKS